MKFRKRPVVIDAFQWKDKPCFPEGFEALHPVARITDDEKLAIETLEGTMLADDGDWIIKGVKGEFYPCKPDIFQATYIPVLPISEESLKSRLGPTVSEQLAVLDQPRSDGGNG